MWYRGMVPRSARGGVLARQSGIAVFGSWLRSRVHTFICHDLSHAPCETSPCLRRWKQVCHARLHAPLPTRLHVDVPDPHGEQVIRHPVVGEAREARRPSIVQTDPAKAVCVHDHRAVAHPGKISGRTRPGDKVWTDWKATGRDNAAPVSPWLQCGPFTVRSAGQSPTTPFRRTSTGPEYQFRVCGSPVTAPAAKGSAWWWTAPGRRRAGSWGPGTARTPESQRGSANSSDAECGLARQHA